MNFLRAAVSEIVGLFVDDWAFALLLVSWVGLAKLVGSRLPAVVAAPFLFLGLAVLTLIFAIRQARRVLSSATIKPGGYPEGGGNPSPYVERKKTTL